MATISLGIESEPESFGVTARDCRRKRRRRRRKRNLGSIGKNCVNEQTLVCNKK
jgi:hypothetical protein